MTSEAGRSEIPNDAILWRRIYPGFYVPDGNTGGMRISSQAFEDSADGSSTSVTIASEAPGPGVLLDGHPGYGLAAITAKEIRALGLRVVRDPTEENPAHAAIVGNKTKSIKKGLVKVATVIVEPNAKIAKANPKVE